MHLGKLQIPKIDIEPFAFIHDFQTRLFVQYAEIVEKTDAGRRIVATLSDDPRVANLEGKMISRGSGAQRFEVKTLAMWFLWYANQHGEDDAKKYLESFLDSDKIPVINTLWVLGIELDEPIALENGLTIQPVKSMPDSREKEQFLQRQFGQAVHPSPIPAGALTCSCLVNRTRGDDTGTCMDDNHEFWTATRRLYEIAFLLNALESVSCLPYYSTSYTQSSTPFGPFGGSGGGSSVYDVLGHGTAKLSGHHKADIGALIADYDRFSDSEKTRLQLILSRLSQAKRRTQIADKILDLGITLEMLLLQDNTNHDQLSLSFRLRGSWLIATSTEERVAIYGKLKDIYTYRSQVAHSGVLCRGDPKKITSVRESFPEYRSLAERICRRVLRAGKPDWDKIVLNAI